VLDRAETIAGHGDRVGCRGQVPGNRGPRGARSILDSTTPRLTFSLVDPYSNNRILWGRIERRVDADGCIGVWLVDTGYPGGFTDLARIAGPFEGGAHGDAGH